VCEVALKKAEAAAVATRRLELETRRVELLESPGDEPGWKLEVRAEKLREEVQSMDAAAKEARSEVKESEAELATATQSSAGTLTLSDIIQES